jgi:hypothetical protein
MKRVLLLVMAVLIVSACTTSQPVPTDIPEDVVIEVGAVIFDGKECTVTGETKLPPGKYSYVLQDESEYEVQMFIGRLLEGKTNQDILDLQGEPGARLPKAVLDEAYDWAYEPGIARLKPDGGEIHTYILTDEGEYTVGVWSYETETIPFTEWFCAPLWIEEAPSE